MKRKTIGIGVGVLMGVLMLVLGGIWYYIQTSAFMDKVESTAATAASEARARLRRLHQGEFAS